MLSKLLLLSSCSLLFSEFYYKVFTYDFHFIILSVSLVYWRTMNLTNCKKIPCFNFFKHPFFLIHFIISTYFVNEVMGIIINILVQLYYRLWLWSYTIIFYPQSFSFLVVPSLSSYLFFYFFILFFVISICNGCMHVHVCMLQISILLLWRGTMTMATFVKESI